MHSSILYKSPIANKTVIPIKTMTNRKTLQPPRALSLTNIVVGSIAIGIFTNMTNSVYIEYERTQLEKYQQELIKRINAEVEESKKKEKRRKKKEDEDK
jgi:uncharacterized membrane protein (DUF106 family)